MQRYSRGLTATEINSSFHKPHQRKTYERWAAGVPQGFRFSVKVPKVITHEARLKEFAAPLNRFLEEVRGLGDKLGPVLVQLPPSLVWDRETAGRFFTALRERHSGAVVVEPRHASWFTAEVEAWLIPFRLSRVAADPALVGAASIPGGHRELAYFRLHGSPRLYYSEYDANKLEHYAAELQRAKDRGAEVWCIFDNTSFGHALPNALAVARWLRPAICNAVPRWLPTSRCSS